ncbi:MAG: hypothetical protein JNJ60_16100, partial [Rhodocyclaceae bacterium]|nr:hypothetical protein [Rhodocyclaceae bacterium]
MLCSIVHRTEYVYTAPVEPARHFVRLRPRGDGTLRELNYSLQVDPWPAQWIEYADQHGNTVVQVDFLGSAWRVDFAMRCEVETFQPALAGPPVQIGSLYAPWAWQALQAYVAVGPDAGNLAALGAQLRLESGGDADLFLLLLNQRLARDIRHEFRVAGGPQDPALTLAGRR